MKTYRDYGIDAPDTGTGEYRTDCPQCEPGRKHKGEKALSVNLNEGVWHCHHCDWRGALPKSDNNPMRQAPEPESKPVGVIRTQPLTPDCIKWLADRGISPETAAAFGLSSCLWRFPKLEGDQPAVVIPFRRDKKSVNWKLRAIKEKAFSQSKNGEQCLFNWDAVRGAKEVIITEGEMDCLALYEAGFHNVCSCPNGAPATGTKDLQNKLAFIDQAEDVFKGAERIILAMDNDAAGIPWEKAIANKLGPERCWQVTWSTECKDANDVLKIHGVSILSECIRNAKPYPVQGLATFADYSDQIIEYYAKGGLVRGLSTGWDNIDELIRLKTGTLNVLTGIPSSGKSEWLDALMLNTIMLHDWKWAVFSPENHPPAYHFGKLAEKWICKPMFDRWSMSRITQEELVKTIVVLSKSIHLLTFDEEAATVEGVLSRFRVCAKLHGIQAAILDPWNELEHSRENGVSETEHIGMSLSKFRNFARLHNVAVWIVAHPTKLQKKDDGSYPVPTPYDISGSANWRNKPDTCISVWRNIGGENSSRVQLHIQKVRDKNLGTVGYSELEWQAMTGRFSEIGKATKPEQKRTYHEADI